jgi:branched-chain amino acid transport system ATP-binding protein
VTVLALRAVSAGYAGVAVVHDVDLTVAGGEVVALLGPNGAGKSTLLLAMSGLVPLMAGEMEVLGEVVGPARRARPPTVTARARRGVAHVCEDRGLFNDLTVAENLRLSVPGRRQRAGRGAVAVDDVVGWFPALGRVMDRQAGLLSGGEQQMLAVARAVVSGPRLLLVDEMSLGLAPVIVEQLLPTLAEVAAGTGAGVLIVEQHVGLALSVADRGYLLSHGRVVVSGSSAELAASRELLEAGYLGGRVAGVGPDTGG